jgi:16S rRNA (cytosine1402-N4)-methyltransferase
MLGHEETVHTPVLLQGILAQLGPLGGKRVVDGTFGGGGYTAAFLDAGASVLALDRDKHALDRGRTLKKKYGENLTLMHENFANLEQALAAQGWAQVDAVVLDLGLSSDQLDNPARGFSYQAEGPLDMRMGEHGQTAADILNKAREEKLVEIFRTYGDEPKARPLAQRIVARRKEQPFKTTQDFLALIEKVYPPRPGLNRRHPAQRIFQALRLEVNEEMIALETVIPQAARVLAPGGKLAVVTFHSLEDRGVKRLFRALCEPTRDAIGRQTAPGAYRQPVRKVVPTAEEVEQNPRARSAILRVLEAR